MTPEDDLESSKGSIIHQLFVRSADENYITARWCHLNELWIDFGWMGAQTIEKYLKAILLINGGVALKQNHNLMQLYDEVYDIVQDSDLLPPHLADDIKVFEAIGNTHSRYRTYGHLIGMSALCQLDRLAFSTRRLIHVLDKPRGYDMSEPTCRQILKNDARFVFRKFQLPLELIIQNPNHKLHDVLRDNNFSFFRPVVGTPVRLVGAVDDSVLTTDVLAPLVSNDCNQSKAAYQLAEWLISSVQLSKDDKIQIKVEMCKAKKSHGF